MLHRVDWLDPFFVGLSHAGTLAAVWLALAATISIVRSRAAPFLIVLVGVAAAHVIGQSLRLAIDRERPPLDYPEPDPLVGVPSDPSLPSGHATSSFAAASLLASLLPRLALPLYTLAALIAASRVYVGVHYPLDIIAGAALGIATATALRWLVTRRRRSPPAPRPG